MAISFDQAFGIHPQALTVRSERAEVLASNLANADTPGYKAKDIDFKAALENAMAGRSHKMSRTDARHFTVERRLSNEDGYRVPNQPDTGDGNTVDPQVERNLFMQNSLEYQASLQFMTSKISGLKKAIKGE